LTARQLRELFVPLAYHSVDIPKVRIGSKGDGGYVCPETFDDVDGVLSIGIGNNASFDVFFAMRGVNVHQFDHTISSTPTPDPHIHFHKMALAARTTPDAISLQDMVARYFPAAQNLVLKFDVEGAEWEAMEDCPQEIFSRFKLIVCELHDLTGFQFKPRLAAQARKVLARLSAHHKVVHVHPNNCCGVALKQGLVIPALCEFTFLRYDAGRFEKTHDPIPSPLDSPNIADEAEIIMDVFSLYS
jgi:hypothetical protein